MHLSSATFTGNIKKICIITVKFAQTLKSKNNSQSVTGEIFLYCMSEDMYRSVFLNYSPADIKYWLLHSSQNEGYRHTFL